MFIFGRKPQDIEHGVSDFEGEAEIRTSAF